MQFANFDNRGLDVVGIRQQQQVTLQPGRFLHPVIDRVQRTDLGVAVIHDTVKGLLAPHGFVITQYAHQHNQQRQQAKAEFEQRRNLGIREFHGGSKRSFYVVNTVSTPV